MTGKIVGINVDKLNKDIEVFPEVHKVTDDMHNTMKNVGRLVMLDRYSFKDTKLITLGLSDLVVLTYKEDPKYPSRGFGFVTKIDGDMVTVELDPQFTLEDGTHTITVHKTRIDKPMEIYYEQISKRVAVGLAAVERNIIDSRKAYEQFYGVLSSMDVVPAGRVLMGAGANKGVTFFNCYVMPFIHDSRGGIAKHREKVMEIMSRGGGVGTNGSTLRPRDAICHGVQGRSSGAVTWLQDLSSLTNLVEQGGSRRGAQMIMLNAFHPDVIEFIISKMQNPTMLRHIKTVLKSKLILDEIDRKLKFTKLTSVEKAQYQMLVDWAEEFEAEGAKYSDETRKAITDAKQKLKDGGTWSVHNPDFLNGANISINISKEFMDAVENDDYFNLRFPDLDGYSEEMRKIYDEEWHECGDINEWESRGYATKVYHTIKAREMWELINTCATYAAEPGVFFIDNANEMTNAVAYGEKVIATNPCGEQPLAKFSVCNLSAINLSNMVKDGKLDVERLKHAVRVSTRLQDNVIDATPYFLEENTHMAKGERRVGMGVMGLADLLIRCEAVYGSEKGNAIVDEVFRIMSHESYATSIALAQEKGSFPFLDTLPNGEPNPNGREKFINSGYMKKMPEHIRQGVLDYGIRNSHLLTVAPTGSTGTMIGCATGLEPYFSFVYYRSGRLGQFIPVIADIAVEWLEANGYTVTEDNVDELVQHLPEWFVGSMDLTPEAHVDVQCIIQNHVDSSISKTVNAPKGYTVKQVQRVYESLHAGGAKGGTVYVDGSRDSQVLTLTNEDNQLDADIAEQIGKETLGVGVINDGVGTVKFGTDVGDTCYVCKIGTLVDSGGCATCNNCGSQSKCGL